MWKCGYLFPIHLIHSWKRAQRHVYHINLGLYRLFLRRVKKLEIFSVYTFHCQDSTPPHPCASVSVKDILFSFCLPVHSDFQILDEAVGTISWPSLGWCKPRSRGRNVKVGELLIWANHSTKKDSDRISKTLSVLSVWEIMIWFSTYISQTVAMKDFFLSFH